MLVKTIISIAMGGVYLSATGLQASAQIYRSSPISAQTTSQDRDYQIATDQSFNQIEGGDAGYVSAQGSELYTGLGYNPYRLVPQDAPLSRSLKLGDLQTLQNPRGGSVLQIDRLSLRQTLQMAGQSPDQQTVGDSPYLSGLTLAEVARMNNGRIPDSVAREILSQARQGSPSVGGGSGNVVGSIAKTGLTVGGQALLNKFAKDPALRDLPLAELANGNFAGTIDIGIQRGAKELVNMLPQEYQNIPIAGIASSLASGDFRGAANQAVEWGLDKGISLASDQLLKEFPGLANTPLGAIAGKIPLSQLGQLIDRPLSTLPRIASQYVGYIPGLGNIPLSKIGVDIGLTILSGDIAAKLDVARAGPLETPVPRTFSGSTKNQVFKAEPCAAQPQKGKGSKKGQTTNCSHFELGYLTTGINKGKYKGLAIVQGKDQPVKGGKGLLAKVNGGWEPTGWKPWTMDSPIKLSLESMKEGSGPKISSANIQANLQICFEIHGKKTCTPHFLPIKTPWKGKEKGLILLASSGKPPKLLQDAVDGLQNNPQYCNYEALGGGTTANGTTTSMPNYTNLPNPGASGSQANIKQYLARIGAGESSGGVNLGAVPSTGSDAPYGEYQFRGSTRDAVLRRYPELDAWSSDKTIRDKAAIAWIGMYGEEVGVDALGAIQKGDFTTADRTLGRNQFTSLPGGKEQSPLWNDYSNLQKYGPSTAGGTIGAVGASQPCSNSSTTGSGSSAGAYTGPTSEQLSSPVDGPQTSGFGPRERPCPQCSDNHQGQDFGVQEGTPVKAAANGKVVYAGWIDGYGQTIFVDHGNGTMTQYSHLQDYIAGSGSTVTQGSVIGISGHTGVGTGPHLHFGVLEGTSNGNIHSGYYVNPLKYLKR
jgi:murein DD-endopeptidase MepM/ murein hydrolase activator NlpD